MKYLHSDIKSIFSNIPCFNNLKIGENLNFYYKEDEHFSFENDTNMHEKDFKESY